LTSISIPSRDVVLFDSAFIGCIGLQTILFEGDSTNDQICELVPPHSQIPSRLILPSGQLNPFQGDGHSRDGLADRREWVNSHGLPLGVVAMIRSELRRHDPNISQKDLNEIVVRLSRVLNK
jgi:hypothetical protein